MDNFLTRLAVERTRHEAELLALTDHLAAPIQDAVEVAENPYFDKLTQDRNEFFLNMRLTVTVFFYLFFFFIYF